MTMFSRPARITSFVLNGHRCRTALTFSINIQTLLAVDLMLCKISIFYAPFVFVHTYCANLLTAAIRCGVGKRDVPCLGCLVPYDFVICVAREARYRFGQPLSEIHFIVYFIRQLTKCRFLFPYLSLFRVQSYRTFK